MLLEVEPGITVKMLHDRVSIAHSNGYWYTLYRDREYKGPWYVDVAHPTSANYQLKLDTLISDDLTRAIFHIHPILSGRRFVVWTTLKHEHKTTLLTWMFSLEKSFSKGKRVKQYKQTFSRLDIPNLSVSDLRFAENLMWTHDGNMLAITHPDYPIILFADYRNGCETFSVDIDTPPVGIEFLDSNTLRLWYESSDNRNILVKHLNIPTGDVFYTRRLGFLNNHKEQSPVRKRGHLNANINSNAKEAAVIHCFVGDDGDDIFVKEYAPYQWLKKHKR